MHLAEMRFLPTLTSTCRFRVSVFLGKLIRYTQTSVPREKMSIKSTIPTQCRARKVVHCRTSISIALKTSENPTFLEPCKKQRLHRSEKKSEKKSEN